MDKIIEQTKEVLNSNFFIVGDFYKFIDKESKEFEIRQISRLSDHCVSFYVNNGRTGITSCYSIDCFEKEQSFDIEYFKSFKEVTNLLSQVD